MVKAVSEDFSLDGIRARTLVTIAKDKLLIHVTFVPLMLLFFVLTVGLAMVAIVGIFVAISGTFSGQSVVEFSNTVRAFTAGGSGVMGLALIPVTGQLLQMQRLFTYERRRCTGFTTQVMLVKSRGELFSVAEKYAEGTNK